MASYLVNGNFYLINDIQLISSYVGITVSIVNTGQDQEHAAVVAMPGGEQWEQALSPQSVQVAKLELGSGNEPPFQFHQRDVGIYTGRYR